MNSISLPVSGELPKDYYKDILQLLVRDAFTLYVYWEISYRKRWLVSQHFSCDWGVMPKVLRIYDVSYLDFHGDNAHSSFDIELTAEADNWYIHPVQPGTSYIVDYGTYTWSRQFVPLLRSDFAMTPENWQLDGA